MTKQQLRDQITDCIIRSSISSQIDNIIETVWGQPFDGITEKIPKTIDATTQYEMGNACYYNNGMIGDYEGAMKWWRKAAEQGNYDALAKLVNAYRKGEGVLKDEMLALVNAYRKGEGVLKDERLAEDKEHNMFIQLDQ